MFFNPVLYKKSATDKIFFYETEIVNECADSNVVTAELNKMIVENYAGDCSDVACEKIYIHPEMTDDVIAMIKEHGGEYKKNDEGFALLIGKEIHIWVEDKKGILFAVASLRSMAETGDLTPSFVYDYPRSSVRGYRVFIPGREQFDQFKRIIDMLVYYKYNILMLEIGGAMEYKKHPEINEKWVEYCEYLSEFPNKCAYHRNKFNHVRDSAHPENGKGSFITQEEMKELIRYCEERNIEIIPEVPGLSHCEYIVMAHPEISELKRSSKFGDTYCPSNPKSYELMFDVFDEIIDVFKPKRINIDHDEYNIVGYCEECRKKNPVDIYTEDIIKTYNYLKSKGVEVITEGDKLMDVGGGAGYNEPGDWDYVPPTYPCRDKLPKDMTVINWYAGFGEKSEKPLLECGFELLYGNFRPATFEDWKGRTERGRIEGAMPANWGPFENVYLQRNQQIFDLIYSAYIFWNFEYDDSKKAEVFDKVAEESFRYYNKYFESHIESIIEITHTTDYNVDYEFFYDGVYIDDKKFDLGDYIVMYSDGTTAKLPVTYGVNISSCDLKKDFSNSLIEVVCSAKLIEKEKMYYKCIFDNPHPEKNIMSIGFLKKIPADMNLFIKEIRF